MGVVELFMSYDDWFRYHSIQQQYYNELFVKTLYRDRWLLYLGIPIFVIIIIIATIKSFVK